MISSEGRLAAYIADLVEEMELLARRENLAHLGDLLAGAGQEARRLAQAD